MVIFSRSGVSFISVCAPSLLPTHQKCLATSMNLLSWHGSRKRASLRVKFFFWQHRRAPFLARITEKGILPISCVGPMHKRLHERHIPKKASFVCRFHRRVHRPCSRIYCFLSSMYLTTSMSARAATNQEGILPPIENLLMHKRSQECHYFQEVSFLL